MSLRDEALVGEAEQHEIAIMLQSILRQKPAPRLRAGQRAEKESILQIGVILFIPINQNLRVRQGNGRMQLNG